MLWKPKFLLFAAQNTPTSLYAPETAPYPHANQNPCLSNIHPDNV